MTCDFEMMSLPSDQTELIPYVLLIFFFYCLDQIILLTSVAKNCLQTDFLLFCSLSRSDYEVKIFIVNEFRQFNFENF